MLHLCSFICFDKFVTVFLNMIFFHFRYLRRGKDIADSQLDVVNTEVARLQQRCESLEKQLEIANKDLTEERQKSQVHLSHFVIKTVWFF